ncbi:hypothetical protein [Paraburkholderia sp. HD33-4]|uniref:hypothetical protein n=1 Tax=Paraburkholderia sp. HD33-4 TaxID=2883242 RepID=UPI001F4397B0|nr:hypothetical protein [Paraburkholderia sp. HD33-4]
MSHAIEWLDEPEHHDYPAALSYLCLHFTLKEAAELVDRLRHAKKVSFKAKDIMRASGLPILGISNSHIERDRQKVHEGQKLSPILLVRTGDKLIIADGYHRACAVYSLDEDAVIPARIV